MAGTFPEANALHSLDLGEAEKFLLRQDSVLARLVLVQKARWSSQSDENPILGLIRIVIAQQISTKAARTITSRVLSEFPELTLGNLHTSIQVGDLRSCGLSPRKAACCATIAATASQILARVTRGQTWEEALREIPGIGPWTLSIFRIMILREQDVLPTGDAGLIRAVAMHYGPDADLEELSRVWSPFRSVACWYLWRSLGNPPLG